MTRFRVGCLLMLSALLLGCRQDFYLNRNFFAVGSCHTGIGRYFPVAGASMFESLYIENLKAMTEEPLCDYDRTTESYRFLWQRAFHNTVSIRIISTANGAHLVFKELDNHFDDVRPKIVGQSQKSLSQREWNELLRRLDRANFGMSPSVDERFKNSTGWDGAQSVLEGMKSGRYIIDDRWSPRADGEHARFREACLYLLELSGLRIEPRELY